MTKLNDKDQEWCDDNFIEGSDSVILDCYPADKVETKLIEKQTEIDELKTHINRQGEYIETINSYMYTEYSEEFQFEYAPQQSLADHDKQVKIDVLSKLCEFMETHEVYFMSGGKHEHVLKLSDVEKFIKQLKGK